MALQGYVELIRLNDTRITAEKRRSLLDHAGVASDHLVDLVETILGSRRLDRDAANFTPAPVNVRTTVDAVAQLIDPREGQQIERELRLAIDPDLEIWGDQLRLREVLLNLIANAVKYSPPGTPIEISATTAPGTYGPGKIRRATARHPLVEIRIRDYGLGVPAEEQHLLFQKFTRLPRDLASTTPGNGMGLYLCRVLVEAMGGQIWVESVGEAGQGSTFVMQLPISV